MNLPGFALKNLAQRKLRSALTCLGVAVAVCAVVALVGVSTGFQESITRLYASKGVDVMVLRKGETQGFGGNLNEEWQEQIAALPGVTVEPIVADLVSLPEAHMPAVQLVGARSGGIVYKDFTLVDGRFVRDDDRKTITLGRLLAEAMDKKVGDRVEVYEEPLEVVGIFESPNLLDNSTAVMAKRDLQRLLLREGRVTAFVVRVEPGPDKAAAVRAAVQRINALVGPDGERLPLVATPAQEQAKASFELQLVHALVWATSLIVLLVSGIGVLNTMMMSVTARTREIGVMRAIGWRWWRVGGLILVETLLLSAGGTAVGLVAGVLLTWALKVLPVTSAIIPDVVSPGVILQASLLALLTGLVGGAYPAFLATRMLPTEAIRHE